MTSPNPVFKFSRAGKVFLENVTLAEAIKLVANKTIQETDHYWTDGMAEWKMVSALSWVNLSDEVKPPVSDPMPPRLTPASTPVRSGSMLGRPDLRPLISEAPEKGFSPYVAIYRSNDARWAYGIFGGLAHRNGWSNSTLFQVRIFTLIFFFPALAYLFSWGFAWLLLTPSLPTAGVKSYYDLKISLRNDQAEEKASDFTRLIWLLAVGAVLVLLAILYLKFI